MASAERMSITAYAQSRGVSRQAIHKFLTGRRDLVRQHPTKRQVKTVDPDEVDRARRENTDPAQILAGNAKPPPGGDDDLVDLPTGKGKPPSFTKARALKETALANMAVLDLREREGRLISRELAEAQAHKFAAFFRRSLEKFVPRVSALVAAQVKVDDVGTINVADLEIIMEQAVNDLLIEISKSSFALDPDDDAASAE